jgi:hypothetical protein
MELSCSQHRREVRVLAVLRQPQHVTQCPDAGAAQPDKQRRQAAVESGFYSVSHDLLSFPYPFGLDGA